MRKNKFMALFLTACMTLTSIGTLGIAASAEDVTEVNVGKGVTYLLPDGETYADTSKVGYRIVKGTDGVTYRVNVGEYKVLMSDDFEGYEETEYTTAITNREINGGKFTKGEYANSTDNAQKLAQDGTNTVAAFGTHTSNLKYFMWTPEDKSIGEAFKVSYKLRVDSFDLDSKGAGSHYFFTNNFSSTSGVQLYAKVTENDGVLSISDTWLLCNGTTSEEEAINDYIEWTEPDADNVVSMKEYITVEIEGNNVQYSASVNGNEVADSVPFKGDISTKGVDIRWAKRNSDGVATVTYADELVYSKAVYVTDTLESVPVTTAVAQGASSAQTATVTLNMSDGTTKDFTVNYTADTSTIGEQNVDGTIDGFDGTIPVTVTVKEPDKVTGLIVNDDFQDAELGTLTPDNPLNGWTVTNTKGTVEDTVITFEKEDYSTDSTHYHITSNNVLKINRTADDTEDSKDYVLRRELSEPVTGEDADVMSVKFNILRNNNNTIKFTVGLESEYDGGVAVSPFEFMLVASQVYLPGSETPLYFDGKYDEYSPRVGLWHEFEILADIKNDYVYFYEQDKLLGSGRIENAAQKIYGLSAITLESDSTGNGSFNNGGGFIWIDDIKVEMFTEQGALQEAGSRLSSLFKGRISDDITLPAKGWYDTDIKWESDADAVVQAATGTITRPASGSTSKANLTATVSKSGLVAEKFYYTAVINPLSVVLDESFEFPRSVNGQAMSARPLTGGMVPWHGWMPGYYTTYTKSDTSGTLVEENESNKAFRLERLSDVGSDSAQYFWTKRLIEPVGNDERASVSFRVKRESGTPMIRMAFGENWITDIRLEKCRVLHKDSGLDVYFSTGYAAANIGEWYNFDFLIDFPNNKYYVYCDDIYLAEQTIPRIDTDEDGTADTNVTFDIIRMLAGRANSETSDSKMLIDDIIVNKLSETELTAKIAAYTNAAAFDTLIKDVSQSRGRVGTVTIRNRKGIGEASKIIVAEYGREDGKLQKVKMYDVPEKSNVKAMQTVVVNQAVLSGNKVKVFVWDNSVIKPLALLRETIIS